MNEPLVPAKVLKSPQAVRILFGYYGFLQGTHLLLILWAGVRFGLTGEFGFPALPPAGGWSTAVAPWLIGNGLLDLFFAAAGVFFCVRFFRGWSGWFRLGLLSLTGALYSAGIFAIGTIPSGAWSAHPISYGFLAVAFAPILPCLIVLLVSNHKPAA